jgi:hypothetical protein
MCDTPGVRSPSCLLLVALWGCAPPASIVLGSEPDQDSDTSAGDSGDSAVFPPEDPDPGEPAPSPVFTIVAVPDTQYLPADWPERMDDTFRWIAENASALNVAFVLGEGDIVQDDLPDEWAVAEAAWRRLDGVVPYALAVGNHDMTGSDTTRFNEAFPRSVQATLPGFGGTRDPERMDDAWHTFQAGGVDWLVLALSWTQTPEQLTWAADLIAAHPNHRVITTTHAYMQPSGSLRGQGELLWSEVLEPAAGATLVVNGHYTSPMAYHQLQVGSAGQEVAALFANYQSDEDGGSGRIRLMEVDVEAGTIRVQSYSPALDAWLDDSANAFELSGLELGRR